MNKFYAVAGLLTVGTLSLRLALEKALQGQPTLVIFTLPIMLSAYLGGLGPGLLATFLSYLAASYYLLPPLQSFAVASPAERWQQFFVALAGIFISVSSEALHRERRRADQADKALHTNDRRLAKIINGMTEACFAVDREWRFTFVNERGLTLLRHSREEMLGHCFWEVFSKLLGTPMELCYRRAMKEGVPVSFEAFSPIAERWLDIRLFPTEEGLAAFLLDVHTRKLGEESLRETKDRLISALEAGCIGTWTWDIPSDRLMADEVTAKLFSIPAEKAAQGLPAQAYLQALFEQDRAGVAESLAHSIEHCCGYEIEYRLPQTDGSFRWIHAKGRVDGDAARQARWFHGAVMDISERKRSEARFRRLVDSNAQGVLFWNTRGEIIEANDAFLNLAGYSRADLEAGALNWAAMTPPEYAHLDQANLEALAVNGICAPIEKEFFRKDGTRVAVLAGAATFEDNPGEGVCFVLDISESRRAREEIQRLNLELEERVQERTAQLQAVNLELLSANQELESFSYSVSHDLRAPLRAIDGFSQATLEDYSDLLPPEAQEHLHFIRRGAQRMERLIDDLLSFSRLSRQPINRRELDMVALVRSVLDDFQSEQANRELELRVGDLPKCLGDRSLLRQVWVNLISNALKYSQKRPLSRVEIGWEAQEQGPVYFVRDNGAGFDMRYAHKLFGVFQRLHASEEFAGTGVGLAIVKRIVNRHGGEVWAHASPDQGATYYFNLGSA